MEAPRRLKFILSAAAIIAAIFCAAVLVKSYEFSKRQAQGKGQPQNVVASAPAVAASAVKLQAINGLLVDPSKAGRPFAVVIENHPDARPQSGLSQADIVYEALAEGGITRFLAVFQTQNVKNIGPVRSARTYFNDWAEELGALYVHVGGNSDALADLNAGDYPAVSNADQYFNGSFFTRVKNRKPPHNVYTSISALNALEAAHRYSGDKIYQDYLFKAAAPLAEPTASTINIKFSRPEYQVKYLYDKRTNTYKRYIAGKADVDAANQKQIAPTDIAVQIVRNWPTQTDTLLSMDMGTHESGNAYVFMDGREISGTWKYDSGRTRFFDASGKELAFDPGQIFIEVVPPDLESALNWK